jgi:hypothetical protein
MDGDSGQQQQRKSTGVEFLEGFVRALYANAALQLPTARRGILFHHDLLAQHAEVAPCGHQLASCCSSSGFHFSSSPQCLKSIHALKIAQPP